jgi:hypothetical protein
MIISDATTWSIKLDSSVILLEASLMTPEIINYDHIMFKVRAANFGLTNDHHLQLQFVFTFRHKLWHHL